MVLPGIQALFGFQLIAVFNPRFRDDLSRFDQHVHYVAITLVALAIAIIMTPAAMHRQLGVDKVTESFLVVSTRLLLASMLPLALGIALDFYLIGRLVLGEGLAAPLAATLVAVFAFFWVALPRSAKLQRLIERP